MKKYLKWAGIVFVVLIVLGAIVGDDVETDPSQAEPIKQDAQTIDTTEENELEIEENGEQTELTDEERILSVLDTSKAFRNLEEFTKVEKQEDEAGYGILVYYTQGTSWNTKRRVEQSANNSLEIFRLLFSETDAIWVTSLLQGEFTDQYGATVTENATMFSMDRETADKITSWDVVKDRVSLDYKNLFSLTDHIIHPALVRNLD